VTGKYLEFTSGLPKDMRQLIKQLRVKGKK